MNSLTICTIIDQIVSDIASKIDSSYYKCFDAGVTLIGAGTAIYSACAWYKYKKIQKSARQQVTIQIIDQQTQKPLYTLLCQPTRSALTRAELKGLLGELPSQGKSYDWRFFHTQEFHAEIVNIADFSRVKNYTKIQIPISHKEWQQIDQQKLHQNAPQKP